MHANSQPRLAGFSAVGGQPPIDEVRRQLGRIVTSPAFRDSPQRSHFLTFIVETTLGGRGHRIKAYTVATEALGRRPSFDPQADPIVRVEAGRLRQALARYYAGAGRRDPLVIELPRGTYVPTFSRCAAEQRAAHATGRCHAEPHPLSGLSPERRQLGRALRVYQQLLEAHLLQIAALDAEIQSARETLRCSFTLLCRGDDRDGGGFTYRAATLSVADRSVLPNPVRRLRRVADSR